MTLSKDKIEYFKDFKLQKKGMCVHNFVMIGFDTFFHCHGLVPLLTTSEH